MFGLFCGWGLTGVRVGVGEALSKLFLGGLDGCSVFGAGVRGARGDEGALVTVFVTCCCLCWHSVPAVAVSLVFSELGATGMRCWQGVLSAVWRMTLVAMALQG